MTMFENDAPADADLEAGAAPESIAPAAATTDAPNNGNGSGNGSTGNGGASASGGGRGGNGSSWSARELVCRAERLARVRVMPAWSLGAALGASSSSSTSASSSHPFPTSAAATIVQQVAAAHAVGLVLCGCAGSGGLGATATSPGQQEGEGGSGIRHNVPLSGTRSVHGKWPTLNMPSIIGSSRHGPSSLSLMTRSWHGKSRHHARGSHRARQAAAAAAANGGAPVARQSGLATAVSMVINAALWDIVGDVAASLVRMDQAPAVLAIRASKPTMSATV